MPKSKHDIHEPQDENPEWTDEMLANARPFAEVFPEQAKTLKRGRPISINPKVKIGFRLSSDLVGAIKDSGRNYNARVEDALRKVFKPIKGQGR